MAKSQVYFKCSLVLPYTWNELVSITHRGLTLRGLEEFFSVGGFPLMRTINVRTRVILRAQLN